MLVDVSSTIASSELFLDPRDHLALTDRATVVRAVVLVGHQPVALPKDPELERVDPQHAVTALREVAELAHQDLVHRVTPSLARGP